MAETQNAPNESQWERLNDVLPILRCPRCRQGDLTAQTADRNWNLAGTSLSQRSLACKSCDESYPITGDGIPILWTPDIEAYLRGASASTAISANMEVYDEISDHYLVHVRKTLDAKVRMIACVESLDGSLEPGWHIDFGCGPGHVLHWLRDWAQARGMSQIGLDVSLQNLRNAAATTGAFVVVGDAVQMPFKDGVATLVTEASVLHHIADWRASVAEACRIAKPRGAAVVFDSEPTKKLMNWGRLARFVFESRFVGYKLMSYVVPSKRNFRNMKLAKLNYYEAEVHNQPGRGFDPTDIKQSFESTGRSCTIYFRMGKDLISGSGNLGWKAKLLLRLSGADWRDPEYGAMTIMAR